MEALQKPGRIAGLWFIGTFVFSLTCNADGEIDGGDVMVSLPGYPALYLVESVEYKHLTNNRTATHHGGLIAIKHALMEAYGRARFIAAERGFLG